MIQLAEFTAALVRVSEKSANIARRMRSEHALFQLLVEEKTGDSKNKRFIEDFKTLGDVLVQETVRHDLEEQVGVVIYTCAYLYTYIHTYTHTHTHTLTQ